MKKKIVYLAVALWIWVLLGKSAIAQQDSVKTLKTVTVKGYRTVNGVGHMLDVKDGVIYAGKKNEVIVTDSLDANKAINNTRQILGRIPGLNIVETESSGFTANGIATRGLNPSQSIEMNTRQNGYTISADVFGYNEAYYLPPMEAVNRIEMVRGAASLQFGPQFGGMVNYVTKEGPADKPLEVNSSLTAGSFGLFNAFTSAGGTLGKWNYYGYVQYRHMEGYRPNSQQTQVSGYGKIQYAASSRLKLGLEYSLLRNRIQMPGGLTDSLFQADPKASTRARNWLKSPWNVLTATLSYQPGERTSLNIKTAYLFSSRALVWRNEDGGAGAPDDIDPATNEYVPREVENEVMRSTNTEVRLSHQYALGAQWSTLAGGLRISYARFHRQGGGEGTTGTDFDLTVNGPYEYDFQFTTTNFAPFVENIFQLGKKLTITPGFRFEYLRSTASGYRVEELDKLIADQARNRYIPLFGLGTEYRVGRNTSLYANISQAYRPIEYGQLEPFGVNSRIDPNLKDAKGYNADLGYRGTIRNILNFDLSLFYLAYNNRIGVVVLTDPQTGDPYSLRTNVANSVHQGIESYVEWNFLKQFLPASRKGLSIFHSFSYIDARYRSGEFKGKRVEAAARTISRIGLVYSSPRLTGTFQVNQVGDAYGDASNVRSSEDPVAGYIPAYVVLDLSATYKVGAYAIKAGVNNLADRAYFTRRTDEYPGPGIIPAIGRSVYVGLSIKL